MSWIARDMPFTRLERHKSLIERRRLVSRRARQVKRSSPFDVVCPATSRRGESGGCPTVDIIDHQHNGSRAVADLAASLQCCGA